MCAARVAVVLAAYAAGALSTVVYGYLSFRHVEVIQRSEPGDPRFLAAREYMARDNPDFVRVFSGKIDAMTLETKLRRCYFFYKRSGIIWEGGDLLYCYDRLSGRYLGAQ